MQSNGFMNNNYCFIASAGAGKTSYIIGEAVKAVDNNNANSVLIITLTIKNQDNVRSRINALPFRIAKRIKVSGWYQFLLKYIIRPYKGDVIPELYDRNVAMLWSDANQTVKIGKWSKNRYSAGDNHAKYLKNWKIYKNYLSEFAYECIKANPKSCMDRLGKIFSNIFIDESQDMAGYDFDVIASMFKSPIPITVVGDPRQHTYSSNMLNRHKKYKGRIEMFIQEKVNTRKTPIVTIDSQTLSVSHRCGKEICTVASLIHHGEYAPTSECSCEECKGRKAIFNNGICGVYWVREGDESTFITKYSPIALTHDRRKRINPLINIRINMGESKGLGFNSCLIYPTAKMLAFLKSGYDFEETEKAKLYVAITRATHIIGFIVPKNFKSSYIDLPYWTLNTKYDN